MTMQRAYPNESAEYRRARNELLQAEADLRAQIEAVAELRRALPPGGLVGDVTFEGANGPIALLDLFAPRHDSLILYSFMYGPDAEQECPMCSAFLDSANGQVKHISRRAAFAVVATSPYERFAALAERRGWDQVTLLSSHGTDFAQKYHSEMPDGSQVPMCHVFVRSDDGVCHFWSSELLFEPSAWHPRHIDMLWPLWHYFDLLPEGRGDFMPSNDAG